MLNSRRDARRIRPPAPAAMTTSTSPFGAAAPGTQDGEAAPGTSVAKTEWLLTLAAALKMLHAFSDTPL